MKLTGKHLNGGNNEPDTSKYQEEMLWRGEGEHID